MKILIILSVPLKHYKEVLASLLSSKEKIDEIAVLTHRSSNADILDVHPVTIFNYNSKRINLLTIGWKNWQKLRRSKFDKIIILYTYCLGSEYDNVKILALLLAAPLIETWNMKGERYTQRRIEFFLEFIKWKCEFSLCFLLWIGLFIANLVGRSKNADRN